MTSPHPGGASNATYCGRSCVLFRDVVNDVDFLSLSQKAGFHPWTSYGVGSAIKHGVEQELLVIPQSTRTLNYRRFLLKSQNVYGYVYVLWDTADTLDVAEYDPPLIVYPNNRPRAEYAFAFSHVQGGRQADL